MYATGRGVPIDPDEARRWFEKAASQGHSAAQPRLDALARHMAQVPVGPAEGRRAGSGS